MDAKQINVGLLFCGIAIADWAFLQFASADWHDFYGIALVGVVLVIVGGLGVVDFDGTFWADPDPVKYGRADFSRFSLKALLVAVSASCLLAAQFGSLRLDNSRESTLSHNGYVTHWRPATSMGIPLSTVVETDCAVAVGCGWLLWYRFRARHRATPAP